MDNVNLQGCAIDTPNHEGTSPKNEHLKRKKRTRGLCGRDAPALKVIMRMLRIWDCNITKGYWTYPPLCIPLAALCFGVRMGVTGSLFYSPCSLSTQVAKCLKGQRIMYTCRGFD